ncbi:uncharacterized protein EURHEDRAFT_373580 [Aspergillus ruber CBS 135680]|uniref:Uncharacterized protein n=1 Tax=Aspergillus ruber (strain CBS 135680) TaxID=1388766 RepID=A0A017SS93_ASPRC|nr:uncharacterized protein EURHEDRAFT_373580 [Aspergillus ruber CBS 135680]EYE99656.1 hypothetical protein EURHEDRAFT_373580 [Aspergillus ruber CBS 135680]
MNQNILLVPLLWLLVTVVPSHAATLPMSRSAFAYIPNTPSHAATISDKNEQPPVSYIFPRSMSPSSALTLTLGLTIGLGLGVVLLFVVGILFRMAITRRRRDEAVARAVEASEARNTDALASGAVMGELEANKSCNQATYQAPTNGPFQAASSEVYEAPQNQRYELA